jgi:hypothetical protein
LLTDLQQREFRCAGQASTEQSTGHILGQAAECSCPTIRSTCAPKTSVFLFAPPRLQ